MQGTVVEVRGTSDPRMRVLVIQFPDRIRRFGTTGTYWRIGSAVVLKSDGTIVEGS
jgi:hypothetical protein